MRRAFVSLQWTQFKETKLLLSAFVQILGGLLLQQHPLHPKGINTGPLKAWMQSKCEPETLVVRKAK